MCQPPGVTVSCVAAPATVSGAATSARIRTESNRRRSRVVLISNRTPKPARALGSRANTMTPDRRLGAQSSAQWTLDPDHPKRRKSRWNAGLRMARPGLEPGTPRFSVVSLNLSTAAKSPQFRRFTRSDGNGWKFADCVLFSPIWALGCVSVPNGRAAGPIAPARARTGSSGGCHQNRQLGVLKGPSGRHLVLAGRRQ
jgi:hypothetical protein